MGSFTENTKVFFLSVLFDILNYFSVNLDKLLINKYIGTTQLGYYDKSYKLMQMPMQNIPFIITPVMHPIFSEMQDNLGKMCIYYSKVVRFLAFIGFPLSILLFFSGEELIYIIFGGQWGASVPAFKILALFCRFSNHIINLRFYIPIGGSYTFPVFFRGIIYRGDYCCGSDKSILFRDDRGC